MVSTQEDAQELVCTMEDEENPMDRGACQAPLHGVAKSWIQLSDQTTATIRKILLTL